MTIKTSASTDTATAAIFYQNKPLSNLEIIDAAKKLSLQGFRRVFLRDTPPKKAKLDECGILNLVSSFGEGTQ